jgi:hypothetical protein
VHIESSPISQIKFLPTVNLGPPLSTTPEEDRHQGAHHRPVQRQEEPHGGGQSGERGEEAATYQTLF